MQKNNNANTINATPTLAAIPMPTPAPAERLFEEEDDDDGEDGGAVAPPAELVVELAACSVGRRRVDVVLLNTLVEATIDATGTSTTMFPLTDMSQQFVLAIP